MSDPQPGNTHDVTALDYHRILDGHDPAHFIADKGYIGRAVTTPIKKPKNGELTDDDKTFNTVIHKARAAIERTIAHFKTWRIMHTDYRRPLNTFATTITTIIGLHFYAAVE